MIQLTLTRTTTFCSSCSLQVKHCDVTTCIYGVTQGRVLGPQLFPLYISHISNIIAEHGIRYAQYTDDTQLYQSYLLFNSFDCTLNLKTTSK